MAENPLPSNVGQGTVTGTFVTAQKGAGGAPVSVPVKGDVTFTATPIALLDASATTPQTILPVPVNVTLDAAGSFTVDLVATDDADLNPTGWNYKVGFKFTGAKYPAFNINVPEGQTVDLAVVAPVQSSNGVQITRGLGIPDTSDATYGDVVTWNGVATVWKAPPEGSGGGGAVDSVNGQTGTVSLSASDVGALPDSYTPPAQSWSEITGKPTIPDSPDDIGAQPAGDYATSAALDALNYTDVGAASAAQGELAHTAVQPGDLAQVATTGAYEDLTGQPSIPRSADDVGALPDQVGSGPVAASNVVVVENGAATPAGLADGTVVVEKSA